LGGAGGLQGSESGPRSGEECVGIQSLGGILECDQVENERVARGAAPSGNGGREAAITEEVVQRGAEDRIGEGGDPGLGGFDQLDRFVSGHQGGECGCGIVFPGGGDDDEAGRGVGVGSRYNLAHTHALPARMHRHGARIP
jgi:hypothetical protein